MPDSGETGAEVLSSELEDDGKRERGETGGTSETGAT